MRYESQQVMEYGASKELTGLKYAEVTTRGCFTEISGCFGFMYRRSHSAMVWSLEVDSNASGFKGWAEKHVIWGEYGVEEGDHASS